MCKLCKCLICPINCPNWNGKEDTVAPVYCVLCGSKMDAEELYYEMHGFPYCAACLRATDGDTLIRICEKSEREWLEGMGFLSRFAKGERE